MAITNVERESVPRKTTVIFFIIDTSGSMAGTRIGAVNSAMEETLEKLREMNADNADGLISVAILEFSGGAKWLTSNGPVSPENYYWNDLNADGLTYMGEAFRMLEEKLHKSSGFMQRASGSFAPVFFLMSDGEPNDDYKSQLLKLHGDGTPKSGNGWFKAGVKVALAVGDEANDHVLMEFTGSTSTEAIPRIKDGKNAGEKLAKMIQFIAVTSSQVASNTNDTSEKTKQEQVDDAIKKAITDDDDFDVSDSSGGGDADWKT